MYTCSYCGAQVPEGSVCACQQNAYSQQPSPYQQQSPYQQPAQSPYGGGIPPSSAPGQSMIKVSGVILTIFGALGLILGFIALAGLSLLGSLGEALMLLTIYELVMAALTLTFGICGISFAPRKEKASAVIALGVTLIALRVIDLIWGIVVVSQFSGTLGANTIVGVLLGCVLPLLYIVGGNARKKSPV